ncbi:MAG: nuclear transport factor 2 family protein [Schleiferiaceae bacterium]
MNSLIKTFYTALSESDLDTLRSCYAENVTFEDPAFGELKGAEVMDMWTFLLSRGGENLKVQFEIFEESEQSARGQWIAKYPFGPKKRPVTNVISSHFEIQDGKITKHVDHFSLWKWSSQALGLPGLLMGWSSWFGKKLRTRFRTTLRKTLQKSSNP